MKWSLTKTTTTPLTPTPITATSEKITTSKNAYNFELALIWFDLVSFLYEICTFTDYLDTKAILTKKVILFNL